jgi:hypothetical protein
MARTIEQIQAGIISDFQAQPELAAANSTSARAIWRLFTFVQATAILILEQIIDVFRAETDDKISKAIPNTASWLTQKVFQFQYSATNPQIVQLIDFAPQYPVMAPELQIITRCSVISTLANKVIVKVAKQDPPVKLVPLEVAALQDYITTIGAVGVFYKVTSSDPDRLYVDADVYYNGQYSSVIQDSVKAAINNYLANLPFNGQIKASDLEISIRAVNGVSDCLIKNLKIRDSSTTFENGTYLIQNKTTISRIFQTVAGYVISEDTVGQTLDDSLNFIPYV